MDASERNLDLDDAPPTPDEVQSALTPRHLTAVDRNEVDGGKVVPRRYECKYYLHPAQVAQVRAFIQPFCHPDEHARGDPPSYVNTTLQLDTPTMGFYRAREADAYGRFKLRVRAYAFDGSSPVTCEVKRKIGQTVLKRRARVPLHRFNEPIFHVDHPGLEFRDSREACDFGEFVRLLRLTGSRPVCLVRYRREAWAGTGYDYARVTFDSRLEYQMTDSWTDWGHSGVWRPCDIDCMMGNGYSGVILELKTADEIPWWMQETILRFDLTRQAICKYALALEREHMLLGGTWRAGY